MNNYNNTGVFDWDSQITKESSFTLLPEGDYRFSIKKFERARHNGSDKIPACPKAIVTFTVTAPDGTSVEVEENYLLHQKMEWKLSEFFAAVGMKKKGEPVQMRWSNELYGKTGVCHLIVHKYQKDGQDREINRIEKLYPAYDCPNIGQPQQQTQQSGGWQAGNF